MIYLNIGSNLSSIYGDKVYNLAKTISFLRTLKINILAVSDIYETPSYPNKSFPKFVNISVKMKSLIKPIELFKRIKIIEKKIGRLKSQKNHPRVCDIDIIDYNGVVFNRNHIQLPHPRLHQRNFVLYPLKDVSPQWQHPIFKKKIDYYINQLNQKSHIEITRLNKNDMFKI
tara:strand:+ start:414 stop:929 length:516 start_codon:yes stop_codon:yes gene_type:complete